MLLDSAEDFSARPVDDATRGTCLRDRAVGPIDVRPERRWPKHGALQSRTTDIGATGLDQQDAARGIFGEARRYGAARRTGADDDVVIRACKAAPTPALHDSSRHRLVCQGDGACRAHAGARGQPQKSPSIELTGGGAGAQIGQEALLLVLERCAESGHHGLRVLDVLHEWFPPE